MFAYLRRLYLEGRLSDQGLDNALTRKPVPWLTQAQADEIRNDKEEQDTAPTPPAEEPPAEEEPATEE